jgi:hypothetical protein
MTTPTTPRDGISPGLADYPLLTALIERRSRRFGVGMTLDGGPLGFASSQDGAGNALTDEEEAALAFAAVGVTGYALGELPYRDGQRPESGSGNIMAQFYARTAPSPESIQSATLFVINDDGAWLIRRPQDVDAEMNARAVAAARAGDVSSFTGIIGCVSPTAASTCRSSSHTSCPSTSGWRTNRGAHTFCRCRSSVPSTSTRC